MTDDAPNASPSRATKPAGDEPTVGAVSPMLEPSPAAYESVVRPFTWRSSLLAALVIWALVMFVVSECAVARSRAGLQDAPPDENRAGRDTPTPNEQRTPKQE